MIYIASHKRFEVPELEGYCPLQVGALGKLDLGYLKDCDGENISYKNPNYCELTGLYWIWKNCNDDYKGLVHYRRYFGRSNLRTGKDVIYTYKELLGFLNDVDILVSYVECFKQSAKEEILLSCCTPEIFDELRESVIKLYPEYIDSFDEYFSQKKSVLFNMLFCKDEIFDAYCEWLFEVLFELERSVDLTKLNAYQQRLYGFLSERLLNVWIKKQHLSVKPLPVVNTDLSLEDRIILILRRYYHMIYS